MWKCVRWVAPAALAVSLAACAGARTDARSRSPDADEKRASDPCDTCEASPRSAQPQEDGYPRAASTTMTQRDEPWAAPPDRFRVRRIGGAEASDAPSRPRRAKKVDIDLVRAPFDEVARLLADTGRFNVVVEAPGASAVTVKLQDIEPYEALLAIAEARGIEVRYRRGVVIVGNAKAF